MVPEEILSVPTWNSKLFYLISAPTQWLDGKHSIFGRIYSGMSVVKRIGFVETDKDDRPTDDVKIVKCTIKYEWIQVSPTIISSFREM